MSISSMSPDTLDRIRGVVFGHAIGDALGFGAEGYSKADVASRYDGGLREFDQIQSSGMRALLKPGMWTDDTSQMLCILESLVEKRSVDPKDVARKLTRWLVDDGFGCGQLVYSVLSEPAYLMNPEKAARQVWEDSGRNSAPNGAVMRTSVLGIWAFNDLEKVAADAAAVARITHEDPRCVASCVAVCVAIAALVSGRPVDDAIELAAEQAEQVEPGCLAYVKIPGGSTLEDLDLDHGCSRGEQDRIGYTYVALSAGFWALAHANSFEEGIVAIINEGGDADTNAAVAGGMLGARFGFSAIPERWVESLAERRYLHSEVYDLLRAME